MQLDVKILFIDNYSTFNVGETAIITVDCDYIDNHDDLVNCIAGELSIDVNKFAIINEEQFWNALTGDPLEKIRNVLRRYFETDDNDNPNKEYDENYCAQAAINDIHSIVGNI